MLSSQNAYADNIGLLVLYTMQLETFVSREVDGITQKPQTDSDRLHGMWPTILDSHPVASLTMGAHWVEAWRGYCWGI